MSVSPTVPAPRPAPDEPLPDVDPRTAARRDWTAVVVPFLLSRLVAVGALLLTGRDVAGRFTWAPIWSWDGVWYMHIATWGYGGRLDPDVQTQWPFFPLLPGVGRLLHEAGLELWVGMVLLSNVAFVVALAGVHRLARLHGLSRAQGLLAVCVVAFFPSSVVFSMIYPSSLFLAGTVWAFVFARQRRLGWCALAASVAVMVRPNGVLVLLPLAMAVGSPFTRARWRGALGAVVRACGPPVALLLVWLALMQRWAGDALVFYRAKAAWDEVHLLEFVEDPRRSELPHVALGLAGAAVVLLAWRRLPRAWLVLAALLILPPLVLGVVGLGRYTNETFPVAMAAAVLAGRHARRLTPVVVVVGGVGSALLAYAVARLLMVP